MQKSENNLLPKECACCEKVLLNGREAVEVLDCCGAPLHPKVVHKTCLPFGDDPMASCPSCTQLLVHTSISSDAVKFIQKMSPVLVNIIRPQLPLRQIVEHINTGWTEANFLARYGNGLTVADITAILAKVQLEGGFGKHAVEALLHFAQYHLPEIFAAVFSECPGENLFSIITRRKILEAVSKNAEAGKVLNIVIAQVLTTKIDVNPFDEKGKALWLAFLNRPEHTHALLKALSISNCIEHTYAFAQVTRSGFAESGIDFQGVMIDSKAALKAYWKVLSAIVLEIPIGSEHIIMLQQACLYILKMDAAAYSSKDFILAVHLLAAHAIDVDMLLLELYMDKFLYTESSLVAVYTILIERNLMKQCISTNVNKWTPLHLVAMAGVGQETILKLTNNLKYGDVHALSAENDTALHYLVVSLAQKQNDDEKMALLRYWVETFGLKIDVANTLHKTPLHLVCELWLPNTSAKQALQIVEFLAAQMDLTKHVDLLGNVAHQWMEGKVSSELALPVLELLLKHSADPNQFGVDQEKTALANICQRTTQYEQASKAIALLAPKMNKNELAKVLEIILTTWPDAVETRTVIIENLDAILKIGVNVGYRTQDNDTLLHLVGRFWLGEHLWFDQAGVDYDSAHKAIALLVGAGVDINAMGFGKSTLLNIICEIWVGDRDSVLASIEYVKTLGASTAIPDFEGDLPIHNVFLKWGNWATVVQITAALDSLLPPSIDTANLNGETLLHIVCEHWIKQKDIDFAMIEAIVALLLARGAAPDAVTKEGVTPLHFVCQLGALTNGQARQLCETLLKKAPAMINAATNKKETPLHVFFRYWMMNAKKDLADTGQIM
ncbi:MAG: hypothetical protein M3R00_09285, partial [Pseudomonadota bacterium]|nr:hypothetical protein [Pseudomonadota bacterium]